MRNAGRRLICRRSGIVQTFIQYGMVPGAKPDAIYVRVMIVSAAFNNKMDKAHKDGR